MHCISTVRHPHIFSHSFFKEVYVKYVLLLKLGKTNYDYDVFIVLIPSNAVRQFAK